MSIATNMGELGNRLPAWLHAPDFGRLACVVIAVAGGVGGVLLALGWLPVRFVGIPATTIVALLSFVISTLLLVVLWSERQAREMTARAADRENSQRWSERRLKEIIDALPTSVLVYDADDRLVLCNAKFREMLAANGGEFRHGTRFEDQLRRSVQLGVIADLADPEAWIAAQKAGLRTPGPPQTIRLATGNWMQLSHQVLSDGSVLALRTDVTEYKERELDLTVRKERLKRLFATLEDVVLELSANGVITYASPAARDILGFEPDQLEGMRLVDLFAADVQESLRVLRRRLSEGGSQSETVVPYTKPSGAVIQIELRLWLTNQVTGEEIVTGTIRDVTDRETAAALAARESALLTSIANASGVHVIVLDRAGNLVRCNSTFAGLLGMTADSLTGQPLSAVSNARPLAEIVETAILDGGMAEFPFESDVVLSDSRDARHTVRFAASAMPEADGSLRYAVLIGIDDTARRAAETALFESAKLAKLGEMAAAMAHELNQPLAVIRMAAENTLQELECTPLQDAGLAEFLNVKLTRIADQTERAAKVISQLRAHARPGDEKPTQFDVPEAVSAALDLVREQLKLDRVEVSVASETCPPIMGHRSRFEQVVINLMTNARDAIKMVPAAKDKPRHGRVEVRISSAPDRKRVLVSVRDSGPGIPDQVLPRLFEPFYTTKPKGHGTGLGLSICHGIVTDMSGSLSARNHPDGGAVFEIELPAAPPAAQELLAPAA